jgi:hypothetical protein
MVSAELRPSDCFWTLTSEGIWYHLLDRPSCTRFHQVVYARAAEAQAEVVADLERTRPPVLLFANDEWWNRVDGVPVAITNRTIAEYVLSRYRPWQRVGEHWFWRRAAAPLAPGRAGCARGAIVDAQSSGAGVVSVSGVVDGPGRVIYLVSAEGRAMAACEAGAGGAWQVEVPAGEAPWSRAYALDPAADALVPLCPRAEKHLAAGAQAERSR